jgi:hypothetical protein
MDQGWGSREERASTSNGFAEVLLSFRTAPDSSKTERKGASEVARCQCAGARWLHFLLGHLTFFCSCTGCWPRPACQPQGAGKKKTGDPRGGWVGQSTKKDWGQIYFFDIYFIVFLNSPHRETPKNVLICFEKKSVLDFW